MKIRKGLWVSVSIFCVAACAGTADDRATGWTFGADASSDGATGNLDDDGDPATDGGKPGDVKPGTTDCLPADVQGVLAASCTTGTCHRSALTKPVLLTYADLIAKSAVDATKSVAQRSVLRMKDVVSPMPASGRLPAAQTAILENWVNAGQKPIACAGSDAGGIDASTGPDEFATPAKCTGGTSTVRKGSTMTPGRACNSCHSFGVAGTVYPTAHEPNDCNGVNGSSGTLAGTRVVITDSAGRVTNLPVNSAGNFMQDTSFSRPAKVKVIGPSGKERGMATPLTVASMGDCNSCHTQAGGGSPAAPGRILLPK